MQAKRNGIGALVWAGLGLTAVGVASLALLRERRKIGFAGKVALITGGSRGLGFLLARRLTREGARVALCARDPAELERARVDLCAGGVPPEHIFTDVCDVTDTQQIEATVRATLAHFGTLDILINNAGTIQVGPMEAQTEQDYDYALKVHFWAPYHFIEASLPTLRRSKGRIVNIASIGGLVHFPHLLPYATSKSALIGFSQGIHAELLKDGVLVTTVAPGLMRTGSPRNALFKGQHRQEYAWFMLADSLPGSSQSADTAAQDIIEALRYGEPFLVTSLAGKAGALMAGVLPGVTADLLGWVNRLLPGGEGPESIGTAQRTGKESESALTQSPLTALTRQAEQKNNQ